MEWNDGYNTGAGYTYSYCNDLNPLRIKYTLLKNGFKMPDILNACELGFGQGLTINFHAADQKTAWTGNDFLPSHVSFALEMSNFSGTNVKLTDESFEEILGRNFDEKFDYICLHGVWSWISSVNREYIKNFINKNLNINGVVYISYNTKPGWASMMPIRDLMATHLKTNVPQAQNLENKITNTLNFANKLLKTNPLFLDVNPTAKRRLDRLNETNINYVAHEFFNEAWESFYFSEVSDSLNDCKLDFVGSTDFLASIDDINLNDSQKQIVSEAVGTDFKQDIRDIYINQSFRKDIWIKGGVKLGPDELLNELMEVYVALRAPNLKDNFKIKGNLGEADLQLEIYEPIFSYLRDCRIAKIGEIVLSLDGTINKLQIIEAINILIAKGDFILVNGPEMSKDLTVTGHKINDFIFNKISQGLTCSFMYSPVTGGGFQLDVLQQLFIGILNMEPTLTPNEIAKKCIPMLKKLGRNVLKDGKPVSDMKAAELEIENKVIVFLRDELDHFKFLGIAKA